MLHSHTHTKPQSAVDGIVHSWRRQNTSGDVSLWLTQENSQKCQSTPQCPFDCAVSDKAHHCHNAALHKSMTNTAIDSAFRHPIAPIILCLCACSGWCSHRCFLTGGLFWLSKEFSSSSEPELSSSIAASVKTLKSSNISEPVTMSPGSSMSAPKNSKRLTQIFLGRAPGKAESSADGGILGEPSCSSLSGENQQCH